MSYIDKQNKMKELGIIMSPSSGPKNRPIISIKNYIRKVRILSIKLLLSNG